MCDIVYEGLLVVHGRLIVFFYRGMVWSWKKNDQMDGHAFSMGSLVLFNAKVGTFKSSTVRDCNIGLGWSLVPYIACLDMANGLLLVDLIAYKRAIGGKPAICILRMRSINMNVSVT
jgi:hypothetical protein